MGFKPTYFRGTCGSKKGILTCFDLECCTRKLVYLRVVGEKNGNEDRTVGPINSALLILKIFAGTDLLHIDRSS